MSELLEKLNDYLDNDSSVIKLTVDNYGIIKHANNYANQLAGRELKETNLSDFFTGFNAMLDIRELLAERIEKKLLNVNTYRKLPQTFYFTSFKDTDGIVLIGEMNSIEIEELRGTMVSLNNELNNLTRELQKKNIQLEQLDKLKNQFLGMAAHDLRNPIASILMFSEFVLETKGEEISDELHQIIDMIKTSSQFMLNLLEELLDVVKIESGKLELNYEAVRLKDLLRKNIKINSIIAAKKDISLVLNVPQDIPEVKLDVIKIDQVLNNLISNAIKYSHRNTTVTISAFSTHKEVLISVQDQGQGIPKQEIDKIFVPFSKISVKGTAGEKSTGLGLSIVKKIVIGHLGRIWVESEVGKGSTFYFTLPVKRTI